MKIVGRSTIGTVISDRAADRKVVERWTLPTCRVVKLTGYFDGLGSAHGDALVRPVIYTAAGALVATGDEVVIPNGQAAAWIDLTFSTYKGGVVIAQGDYDLGFIWGGLSLASRAYSDPVGVAAQRRSNIDTYSDGPSNPLGAPDTSDTQVFSWYATYVNAASYGSDDLYDLAQLPFYEAQAALASLSNPLPITRQVADCGWHGTVLDDGQGAFVVVDPEGPLADLVGHVVQVSAEVRSVYAFCHRAVALDEGDALSLPRSLFLALSTLSAESVPVSVEVLV